MPLRLAIASTGCREPRPDVDTDHQRESGSALPPYLEAIAEVTSLLAPGDNRR
ncbi:hypothetical protein [Streptomyces sp. NPDC001933]|uniref:hypothetical protein n=1 Tax=Streptomyces sp. NPDC001933 TaxID=3364626 RepID=UPI0036C83AC3